MASQAAGIPLARLLAVVLSVLLFRNRDSGRGLLKGDSWQLDQHREKDAVHLARRHQWQQRAATHVTEINGERLKFDSDGPLTRGKAHSHEHFSFVLAAQQTACAPRQRVRRNDC
ncbi:hypothetical protein K491DRAFT_681415 [Lophiostoma macrostomum CBS 122681]|uniref:Uncharacterized protein n=1 Tax=Lophiostoma macrostomum CBS 122681 TaxID=1314788 RepID=A0A6A6SZD9_9PLEO|nr:hypothetical protein K491DRAFT_681415 [Lophiostoma macrostomum CBS 122681]